MDAPKAPKKPKELETHGHLRIDDYYWLNDRENQDVLDYLKAENEFVEKEMSHTKRLQRELYDEMKGRIKEDDSSVPYFYQGYFYYTRYEEGKEYAIHCRKPESLDSKEEVILDVNHIAEGLDFCQVAGLSINPDNNRLSYGLDDKGRRQFTIHIKDLESGELLSDRIPNTTGTSTWSEDGQYLFFTTKDDSLRAHRIWRHKVDSDNDQLVYEEKDETFGVSVFKTKSKEFIFISSYSTLSSEYRFIRADQPLDEFIVIQAREKKLEYSVDHYGDRFYILTNLEAKNFRLMSAPIDQPAKKQWVEEIAHRDNVLLEDIELFKDFWVIEEREMGIIKMRVIPRDESSEHYIRFPEPAYSAYTSVNLDFDSSVLRLGYTSMTTPVTIYDYDLNSRGFKLMKQQEVLGGFDKELYQTDRVEVESRDGVQIPMSIVYRKDMLDRGNNPFLLYGYGSYGHSLDPYFSSNRLSLLDRGFVYAIAHIRGGEELGRDWYEHGKLLKKKNTFYDFIDCGQYAVEESWADPQRIYAMGGSAGGLLMGAVINMRPDLFKGVVAAVPFVDVVTTMLDDSIPLTTGEYDEWGNPNDREYYDYILSYSPYDNVEEKFYPHLLVTTGLHDSQVQYWEPAKWVAKLREKKVGDQKLYLRTDMTSGHGGASGRFQILNEIALDYAFLIDLAGV